ncbi:MAG: acyltransferase [Desulfovibrio sp.]
MIKRLVWYWKCNRLGPDILSTYPLLFFKKSMTWICKKKLKHIGDGAEVRPGVCIAETQNVSIGKNVVLRPGTFIYPDPDPSGEVIIEDDVLIGPGVHFYANNHAFSNPDIPISEQGYDKVASIHVKKGAWLGGNVVVLPGVTIGENSVVGAGSVVTKDVPPYTVYVGSPAKKIKDIK